MLAPTPFLRRQHRVPKEERFLQRHEERMRDRFPLPEEGILLVLIHARPIWLSYSFPNISVSIWLLGS
jgi:hypothetical protein